MHHFIYPSQDTYITNRTGLDDKNFGIDEILQVGTSNVIQRVLSTTKDYYYISEIFNSRGFDNFTGIVTGSFGGTSSLSIGTISGSGLEFSASYFSGSIDGVSQELSASVISGSLIDGIISGSLLFPYVTGIYTGQLTGSNICFTGTGSGTDAVNEQNWTTDTVQFVDRAMLKFDISAISASVANGTISNPQFFLKLKVCNEYDLPIAYRLYALPISQSWEMGDGYLSDGGSDLGASWTYRNVNNGNEWYSQSLSGARHSIDFITNPSLSTASFAYDGGTWYTSSWCSQSFQYQSSDVYMDVTSMALAWISGTLPNEGLIVISSDELVPTGSGFILKFFSQDTNTIYSSCLDVAWNDSTFITGSESTASVSFVTVSAGMTASIQSGSTFTIAGGISGSFSSSTFLTFVDFGTVLSASGIIDGKGLTGNIDGMSVFGFISTSIDVSQSLVTGPCGKNFSASLASGSFYDGMFSGSTFTAYYVDYKFENAILTGSWTEAALLGTVVTIQLPSPVAPYAYAYVSGAYISGKALGTYTISGSTSASFHGQFIQGNLLGGYLNAQLSGSVYTSSFTTTGSVEMTSSLLSPVDIERPFTVVIQNLSPTYRAGDIVKIGVFGRKQFPLKTFGKTTQQQQYLIPEFLPSSSYYALRDNQTEEIVLNFDNYTQLSCEYPYGNYFIVDTTGLPQERYYRVLIRVNNGNETYTIDTGKTFKIVR
jgi:hypothetical protein